MNSPSRPRLAALLAALASCFIGADPRSASADDAPFEGVKSAWRGGFDRYDYVMDEASLAVAPFQRPANEGFAVRAPEKGKRRCVVVAPKEAAPGKPWSWQGCYWDHEPQAEVELLRRGFHIAFITPDPGKEWDAWHAYLVEKHGLSSKPAFIGMSRGGVNAYEWAAAHPDRISCIYADNPAIKGEAFAALPELVKNNIALLNICGSEDFLLERHTLAIEDRYRQLGGWITVIVKDGQAHHPHSLRDPKPIADWIEERVRSVSEAKRPSFADATFSKSYYYSLESSYREFKAENTFAACRGPGFVACYDRYDAHSNSQWGLVGASVIVPKTPAPGVPWMLRIDPIRRDAALDQALLAKGFHIVIAPLTAQAGYQSQELDALYERLVAHGFSRKPVLAGSGTAAGEAYAWAIANPGKTSCVYGENPALRSLMTKEPILDRLEPLAKADVPLIHACGSRDPWLNSQTRAVETRYKALKGRITVVIDEGKGHEPLAPRDPEAVADLIIASLQAPPAPSPTAPPPPANPQPKPEAKPEPPPLSTRDYRFDRTMSRRTLENYLSRAISMEGMLNGRGDLNDNLRMLKNVGAKFIGRAFCVWGGETELLQNLERAKQQVPKVHEADPEMILQACIFEIVTTQVERVPVPDWAFKALGQEPERRNFRYADMLYPDGKRKDHWRPGHSVPDISRPETQLWFYFLAVSYIDIGIEAIHFGQTELMNGNDRDLAHYSRILGLVRDYASQRARRHMILCDSHVPSGGLKRDGRLLMDFHSFPLRIKETPDKPQEATLEAGFSDGIYGRSKGGMTYSGWECDHLPYLVEIDNWGVSRRPGQPRQGGIWVWGYDEITWFAHQSREYRADWLRYAQDWVRKADPAGHLQMPGSRTMRSPLDRKRWYYANNPSAAVPDGLGDETAIRAIWAADSST